jgi:hypothetical protein
MALQLYRRHGRDCSGKRARHDRSYRRCRCPIHAEGTLRLDGFIRKSTGETSWERAEEIKARWEHGGTTADLSAPGDATVEPQTIEAAAKAFFDDARARKLAVRHAAGVRDASSCTTGWSDFSGKVFTAVHQS